VVVVLDRTRNGDAIVTYESIVSQGFSEDFITID
jgi:hypothetical protein